jgi:uncharacterized protein YjiS (DUF1127 family)
LEDLEMVFLAALVDGFRMYRLYHEVTHELESYSLAELNDLGLSPADLPQVAWEEAERRLGARHAPAKPGASKIRFGRLSPVS